MRQYFATFTDDLTDKIDGTYMKYASVFGPSCKECRKLSKLFYQAVNLMEDRVILEREWLKLKEKEPSSSTSSGEPSPSTAGSESSPLLANGCPDETTWQVRVRRFIRRFKPPRIQSNVVRETIEARSKDFVERAQREFR